MSLAYNIAIYFYYFGVWVASFFSKKVATMWKGEKEAFAYLKENIDSTAKYLWFHAASLGEFEQGRPMMERICKEHPEYKILLTFFSPSGYEVRKDYKGADLICYLPLDTPYNARHFVKITKPVMAFFIKYEFWNNYLHVLKHKGIPSYSISSIFRDGQIFFRWYGKDYSKVLKCFTHLYVQNEKSRKLLSSIGIDNTTIVGDTRFDRVLQIRDDAKHLPLVETFIGKHEKTVFIAGSSWPGDEAIFIPYFNKRADSKMIIAPHVVTEEHLAQIIAACEGKIVRYTQAEGMAAEELAYADVLIIDCYGLLSSIYHYADITLVGGGFGHTGVHNVLEAAVWDKPVVYGPNYEEYREAIGLMKTGGGLIADNEEAFGAILDKLIADKTYLDDIASKAGAYVKSQQGATEKILNLISL